MDLQTPVKALVAVLQSTGMSASVTAADVNVPGAWVAVDQVDRANVHGSWELRCQVFLIAADTDPLRAMEALGTLLDQVLSVLEPDGPVVTQGVVMPDNPTPLPGLRVPVNLYT